MLGDPDGVGKYTAIMTETDRERVAGEADVPPKKRYQAVTRVRKRIEALEQDREILEAHHPDLFDELQAAVCEDE